MQKCFPTVDPQEKRRQTDLISWNSASWMMFAFRFSKKNGQRLGATHPPRPWLHVHERAKQRKCWGYFRPTTDLGSSIEHIIVFRLYSSCHFTTRSEVMKVNLTPRGAPDLPAASGFGVIQHRPGCMRGGWVSCHDDAVASSDLCARPGFGLLRSLAPNILGGVGRVPDSMLFLAAHLRSCLYLLIFKNCNCN